MPPWLRLAPIVLTLLLTIPACSQKPVSIRLSLKKLTFYGFQRTEILRAEVLDKNDHPVPKITATFESSNSKVVSVDASGLIRSLSAGKATITAKAGELSAQIAAEVFDVTTITVTPARVTMAGPKGMTVPLTAEVRGSTAQVVNLVPTWSTSDAKIATVDAKGVVTALADGRVAVTAQLGDVGGAADLRVLLRELVSFDVSPKTVLMHERETQRVSVSVRDSKGMVIEDVAVAWTSSDPTTAVCSAGVITALAPGSATITGRCGAFTAEISVVVY